MKSLEYVEIIKQHRDLISNLEKLVDKLTLIMKNQEDMIGLLKQKILYLEQQLGFEKYETNRDN